MNKLDNKENATLGDIERLERKIEEMNSHLLEHNDKFATEKKNAHAIF